MTDSRPFGTYAPTGFALWVIEKTRRLPDRWATRRIAHVLRRLAIRSLHGAPVDVEAFGTRMRLYPDNNLCEKKVLFTPQFFDPEEFAFLRSRMREDLTFIDIGASVGPYSLFVASLAGPKARILSVEPQPDIFDRLTFNIRQNPFGTIKAIDCAIADKCGELTLFLDARNMGQSSVQIVGSAHARSIRVPAVTLLDLLRNEGFARVDAVKLDVEGAEDLILDPFFRDAPPALYPSFLIVEDERKQWQVDLPRILEEKGYRLLRQTRSNLIYERAASTEASRAA
jgi:FkbM family methyltransferase